MSQAHHQGLCRRVAVIVFFILLVTHASAFVSVTRRPANCVCLGTCADNNNNNNNENLDDLKPPLINWRRESILFGDKPATQKNNNSLRLWRSIKSLLPPIITGAYKPTAADDNPIGALFNLMFIRIPILLSGVFYVVNLATGHPLVMDVGYGPLEVSPILVGAVLYLMLL